MVENRFVSPAFRILLEYGVPDNAIRVIQNVLKRQYKVTDDTTEDKLMRLIRINKNILTSMLGRYELEIIERIL